MSQAQEWAVSSAGIECHRGLPSPRTLALVASPGRTRPLLPDFPHQFIHSFIQPLYTPIWLRVGNWKGALSLTGWCAALHLFPSCKFRLDLNKFLFVAVRQQ